MSVLSFRKSVDQLDLVAEQHALLQKTLARIVQATSQYAIELKLEHVEAFRANLERIQERARRVGSAEDADQLQSDFRGELRVYLDMAVGEVQRMRSEMSDVVTSMQTFLNDSVRSGTNHQQVLKREFKNLDDAAQAGDLAAIRGAVRRATETAFRSYEEIQRTQETVIAQLQDEIRHLHEQVDHERKAALSDPVTNLWNRGKLDARIKELLLLNEEFCVYFVGVPRLLHLSRRDPRIGPLFLRGLAGRLQTAAGGQGEFGMAGRWSAEVFAIIFNLPLASAPASPGGMQSDLSGDYAVQVDGSSINLGVEVAVQAIERLRDVPEAAFYQELGQAAFRVTMPSP